MEKIAIVYLRPGDDRNDVVQEAALRAWVNRRQFRGDSKFTSWVHTIVRNVVLDGHRRKHARRRPVEVSMPDFFDAVDEQPIPAQEDWHKVEKLLPTLTPEMQRAVRMRIEGREMGPMSTMKVRYHRAVLMLRARMLGKARRGSLRRNLQHTGGRG